MITGYFFLDTLHGRVPIDLCDFACPVWPYYDRHDWQALHSYYEAKLGEPMVTFVCCGPAAPLPALAQHPSTVTVRG